MFDPISTYRVQLHKDFTFRQLTAVIPYLHTLGIKTIYASPVFESVPGSIHGYDAVNVNQINPEIGTEEELRVISKQLHELGMSWIQDIVPNHMAFHHHNLWLMDVLEKGEESPYAHFFDIDTDNRHRPLMAPFLGASLQEVTDKNELQVAYEQDRFVLKYHDAVYPLRAETQEQLRQLAADPAAIVQAINNDKAKLRTLIEQQHYVLCPWQETDKRINYRRFFTVNGLICLNTQNEHVFNEVHRYIKTLVDEGIFQGLRIDHIDGLYDPEQYLQRLRRLVGEEVYITVEKILQADEELPRQWPVQGSTGYDFLAMVNNVITDENAERTLTRFYQTFLGDKGSIEDHLHEKKSYILKQHMHGELDNLYALFIELELASADELSKTTPDALKEAIAALLVHCSVYRYYGNIFPLNAQEQAALRSLLKEVARLHAGNTAWQQALALLQRVLLEKPARSGSDFTDKVRHFYARFMQLTGPLMAKGAEDTLMYTYNRFIAHNDVGDSAEVFGFTIKTFHEKMIARQKQWPLAMNATSTHDTKRGEDVRARLNVITDLADEWIAAVQEWQKLNAPVKQNNAPDANDEYFIYQTLTGAYPLQKTDKQEFSERLQQYLQKALREAKTHSQWSQPDEAYEQSTLQFAASILEEGSAFRNSFDKLQRKISQYGVINSLAQLVLKHTCPGVPDTYQGTENWDLSFVDPDNRRPVDYDARRRQLNAISSFGDAAQQFKQDPYDPQVKLALTKLLLQFRNTQPKLFAEGFYIPLQAKGAYRRHVLAFARRHAQRWCIVIVPLQAAALCMEQQKDFHALDWKDTAVVLPPEAPAEWKDLYHAEKHEANDVIQVGVFFSSFPVIILEAERPPHVRSAGVLLAVSSLPSPFGIGDFGPGARAFADMLGQCCQQYWQLLPLNPSGAENHFSPYSSTCSMAGNPLLISPEGLADAGLLDADELKPYYLDTPERVDYEGARKLKYDLLDKAYARFGQHRFASMQQACDRFCAQEASWLDDFADFIVLRSMYEGVPWFRWPDRYKNREAAAIEQLRADCREAIHQVKWRQFIFHLQWNDLKAYCHRLGIRLMGDLPFYISHNSADVWAHPDLFCIDRDGNMTGIAGVPPDYFSEDGQLWNVPVYCWDVLKAQQYRWWIDRLRKNLLLFDLLRIDHFRGFDEYWEVPAGEETARNGQWKPGPGVDFFQQVKEALGELPFVAEDLGDHMETVYALRKKVGLPGMKVLQFAFGRNMPQAVDVPHYFTPECLVYTGTHDNNTALGWFRQETSEGDRARLDLYTGVRVTENNVHDVLAHLAYASVAQIAILPVQDIVGLDERHRMNVPGSEDGNWKWRMKPGLVDEQAMRKLRQWAIAFHRI